MFEKKWYVFYADGNITAESTSFFISGKSSLPNQVGKKIFLEERQIDRARENFEKALEQEKIVS